MNSPQEPPFPTTPWTKEKYNKHIAQLEKEREAFKKPATKTRTQHLIDDLVQARDERFA